MRNLLAPAVVFAVFGIGQSMSGWQSPLIGVTMMAVAGLLALAVLTSWLRPRWAWVDHCYTFVGIAPPSDVRALVPDEHHAELRAVVQGAAQQMAHPAPVFWPVDNPRLQRAAAAHFPDLTVLVRAYAAAERTLNGTHAALTERITGECESRGVTESDPTLRVHAALYSRLLAIAEDRVPHEGYAAEWEAAPTLPGLTFTDALDWPEVGAIRDAYDAERAALLAARARADHDVAREVLYATPDCPTCALNLGGSSS